MTNTFNYSASAKRVVNTERDAITRERDYSALVVHFEIGADSDSAVITDAARRVTIDGEAANGRTVTEDMLTGRNPGPGASLLPWKTARAVRIGLVAAIARANGETEDDEPKPITLRATLSGEGGGSVTIDPSDAIYAAVVALITASK